MNVFLITLNVLLWIWQFREFRKKRENIRDKALVYCLYAIALSLMIMSAKNWIMPDLLRPFIRLLQQVHRLLGAA